MPRKVSSLIALLTALAIAGPLGGCNRATPPGDGDQPPPPPAQGPARKPGLWKQTISIEPGGGLQSSVLCLDKATDAQISWWGNQGARAACTRNEVKRNPDGSWTFSSVCPAPDGSTTTTSGSVVGDFNVKYQLKAEVTTANSPVPEMAGTHSIILDGEWQGECPADMRPGDMALPNGQRANLIELSKPPPAANP